MKKAVIYSRVSTLEQDYTSQTAELKKEAEKMGYEVTHIYEEKESGFVDDRPELAKVLALTNADTDAVFVWEISRLSRRTVMVLSTIEDIEKKGILIYAKNENYRSWNDKGVKDSTSKLVLTLYASIAEAEALKFKERWKNRGGVTPEAEGRLTTENFLILTPKVSWPTGSFLFQRITSWRP